MKEIRIYALGFSSLDSLIEILDNDLKNYYKFIWDEENPEYLIATEVVYYQYKYAKRFKELLNDNIVTIFFTGESISPDLNIFDYALVFDRNLTDGDRICRIPTMYRYRGQFLNGSNYRNISEKELLDKKTLFCNFMYSNPHAHENRDKLFYKLSEYKKVDSLGPHLNNVGNQTSRNQQDWYEQSIIDRFPYKFSIAAENVTFKGNITEKILSCFEAATVPIYWGDPTIAEEFNTKAFINCHEYNNFDDVLDRVKKIDRDDDLWYEIISQPIQTDEQIREAENQLEKMKEFLNNIFSQNTNEAKRVGIGYHPDLYRKRFKEENDDLFVSKRETKLQSYYGVMNKWLALHNKGKNIADLLCESGYKNIAIYGMGELGKNLFDELYGSSVCVDYVIDQSKAIYKNSRLVSINDELDRVDAIVVTIPFAFESIKKILQQKIDCDICSIEEVLSYE